jgi:phosphate acetyltransferase
VSFIDDLRRRAAARRRRIAFPECGDERTQTAMHRLKSLGIVEPVAVLPSDAGELRRAFTEAEISCIAPAEDPRLAAVTDLLLRRRAARGLSAAEAGVLAQDPLFFADGLVALDEIDGCVAGAVHASAHVVRAALWCVGAAHAGATVSSAFYLALPARSGVPERVLTFTDCAVVPEPTSQQLVEIVLAAAAARRKVVGDEPRVALLSYSTLGSGSGSSVDRVRSAVALVRQQAPGLLVDGELQADAALVESVAMRKAPGSIVAGAANVLVFPSLDAGNIAYKLVERLVPAIAVGPVLQGIARPCSDLSRGADVDDIINVAAVTALIADETGRVITGGIRRETDP